MSHGYRSSKDRPSRRMISDQLTFFAKTQPPESLSMYVDDFFKHYDLLVDLYSQKGPAHDKFQKAGMNTRNPKACQSFNNALCVFLLRQQLPKSVHSYSSTLRYINVDNFLNAEKSSLCDSLAGLVSDYVGICEARALENVFHLASALCQLDAIHFTDLFLKLLQKFPMWRHDLLKKASEYLDLLFSSNLKWFDKHINGPSYLLHFGLRFLSDIQTGQFDRMNRKVLERLERIYIGICKHIMKNNIYAVHYLGREFVLCLYLLGHEGKAMFESIYTILRQPCPPRRPGEVYRQCASNRSYPTMHQCMTSQVAVFNVFRTRLSVSMERDFRYLLDECSGNPDQYYKSYEEKYISKYRSRTLDLIRYTINFPRKGAGSNGVRRHELLLWLSRLALSYKANSRNRFNVEIESVVVSVLLHDLFGFNDDQVARDTHFCFPVLELIKTGLTEFLELSIKLLGRIVTQKSKPHLDCATVALIRSEDFIQFLQPVLECEAVPINIQNKLKRMMSLKIPDPSTSSSSSSSGSTKASTDTDTDTGSHSHGHSNGSTSRSSPTSPMYGDKDYKRKSLGAPSPNRPSLHTVSIVGTATISSATRAGAGAGAGTGAGGTRNSDDNNGNRNNDDSSFEKNESYKRQKLCEEEGKNDGGISSEEKENKNAAVQFLNGLISGSTVTLATEVSYFDNLSVLLDTMFRSDAKQSSGDGTLDALSPSPSPQYIAVLEWGLHHYQKHKISRSKFEPLPLFIFGNVMGGFFKKNPLYAVHMLLYVLQKKQHEQKDLIHIYGDILKKRFSDRPKNILEEHLSLIISSSIHALSLFPSLALLLYQHLHSLCRDNLDFLEMVFRYGTMQLVQSICQIQSTKHLYLVSSHNEAVDLVIRSLKWSSYPKTWLYQCLLSQIITSNSQRGILSNIDMFDSVLFMIDLLPDPQLLQGTGTEEISIFLYNVYDLMWNQLGGLSVDEQLDMRNQLHVQFSMSVMALFAQEGPLFPLSPLLTFATYVIATAPVNVAHGVAVVANTFGQLFVQSISTRPSEVAETTSRTMHALLKCFKCLHQSNDGHPSSSLQTIYSCLDEAIFRAVFHDRDPHIQEHKDILSHICAYIKKYSPLKTPR